MSGKTDLHSNAVINHFLRTTSQTSTGAYLALFSAGPTATGGGTELTGNGYARQAVTFGAPSTGDASNSANVTFTAAGGAWSAIVGHALYPTDSAGTMMYWESGVGGPTLGDGDSYQFVTGAIDVAES